MLFEAEGNRPKVGHNHRLRHWEYGSSMTGKIFSGSIVFATRQPAYLDSPKHKEQGSLRVCDYHADYRRHNFICCA